MRLCVLHNFDNQCSGRTPIANCRPQVQDSASGVTVGAMVQGPAGDENFYGATPRGGKYNAGTVYMLTPAGDLTVLYNFGEAGITDGAYPSGGLTLGKDGSLYGVTYAGGQNNVGSLYRMARAVGKPEILYSFRGGKQDPPKKGQPPPPPLTPAQIDDLAAAYPVSAPILGSDNKIYGVTPTSNPGGGVLYRLGPDRVLKCLHRFKNTEAATYGLFPSTLTLGSDGSFYGTTQGTDQARWETVFQFNPNAAAAGGVKIIYKFTPGEGAYANGVIQGADHNLYGATYAGGPAARGVVFRLTLGGQYTILHAFGGNVSNPVASVVEVLQRDFNPDPKAPQTNTYYLYGAAALNHSNVSGGPTGILFREREDRPDFATVYNTDVRTGAVPNATPVLARDSTSGGPNLYGTMAGGGTFSAGVFYRLNTAYFVSGQPETDSTSDPANPHEELVFEGSAQGNTWVYDSVLVPLVQVSTFMTAYLPSFVSKVHTNGITVRVRNPDAKIVQFFYRQRFDTSKKGQAASDWVQQYDAGHKYARGDPARFNNFLWLSTIDGNFNNTPPSDPGCEKLGTCGGDWLPAYQIKGKHGLVSKDLCGLLDRCTLVPACVPGNPYAAGSYECVPLTTNASAPLWMVDAQGREPGSNGLTDPYYLASDTEVDCDGYTLYDSPSVLATADEDWKFTGVDYVIMHRYVVATVTWVTEMKPNASQPSYSVSIKGAPGAEACSFKKLLDKYKFEQPFDLPFACPK